MEYWYEKRKIPLHEKKKIGEMVLGEAVGEIHPEDQDAVKLYKVSDDVYHRLFEINRLFLYQGDCTAPAGENDYRQGYNIVTENGLAGLYVTSDGWLVSVYSNEEWRGFVRLTSSLVKEKIKKVVCIAVGDSSSSGLVQLYMRAYDLKVVAETVDDREIMTEYYGEKFVHDFCTYRGIPHHVFLGRKNLDVNDVRIFTDYFQALDYVENIMF